MEVGLTMNFRNVLNQPWREFWEDSLWIMTEAEAMGFDYLGIQEHFFMPDGYSPSVPVFLTLLAERTKSIRIGSYLYLLPLHHAAQVAQETAVLDHISEGRLDVAVGMGHRAFEYVAMGYSPKTRPSRMEEGLSVLKQAWTGEPFSFHGKYYDFDDMVVRPAPLQRPHPPLYVGGSTVAAAERAARHGAHFAAVTAEPHIYEAYLAGVEAAGGRREDARISTAWVVTTTYEDPEKVWQRNREHYIRRWSMYDQFKSEMGDPELEFGTQRTEEKYRQNELIGDPDTVLAMMEKFCKNLPLTRIVLGGVADGIPLRTEAYASLKLFAEKVLPTVKSW